jgi:hypothetical protein
MSDSNNCYSGGFNTSSTVGGMFKSTQNLGVSDVIDKKIKHYQFILIQQKEK